MNRTGAPRAEPYLLLGESRRRLLQERLSALIERWYRHWAPDKAGELFTEWLAEPGTRQTARAESWGFAASQGDELLLQAVVRADFLRVLSGFGHGEGVFIHSMDSSQGHVAAALTEEIMTALCLTIAQAALPTAGCTVKPLDPLTLDPAALRRRRRTQALTVSIATEKTRPAIELTLAPVLIEALLAERPPVSSREPMAARRSASTEQPMRLNAVLGSATVSWRELTDLCVGDVIVLDQALSAPCVLQVGASTIVADAQLGQVNNALAAQVTRIRAGVT